MTSLLELALWKKKIDDSSLDHGKMMVGGNKKIKMDSSDFRLQCRINCGADHVVENVLPYLLSPDFVLSIDNSSDDDDEEEDDDGGNSHCDDNLSNNNSDDEDDDNIDDDNDNCDDVDEEEKENYDNGEYGEVINEEEKVFC
jgi:hypothetical protein